MSIDLAKQLRGLPFVVLILTSLALPVLVSPSVARAQDDATTEMARQRFKEGVGYFDAGDYEKARLAFLQAYTLKAHPAVLLNLAQSELRSGHPADAANHFAQYLREGEGDNTSEAREGLSTARKKAGEVAVNVDVEGAVISVDGKEVGQSPLPAALFVEPGSHTISATKGESTRQARVTVEAGDKSEAKLLLSAPSAGAPADSGDGSLSGSGSMDVMPDSGGRKGFGAWFADTPLAWVGAGLAVVGIGGSVFFAFSADNSYKSADETADEIFTAFKEDESKDFIPNGASPCGPPPVDELAGYGGTPRGYGEVCQQFVDQNDEGDKFKTFAIVSAAVGGTALVGTLIYYFVDPGADLSDEEAKRRARQMASTRITPVSAPHFQGIAVSGSF